MLYEVAVKTVEAVKEGQNILQRKEEDKQAKIEEIAMKFIGEVVFPAIKEKGETEKATEKSISIIINWNDGLPFVVDIEQFNLGKIVKMIPEITDEEIPKQKFMATVGNILECFYEQGILISMQEDSSFPERYRFSLTF